MQLIRQKHNVWNDIILNEFSWIVRYERLTGIRVDDDFPAMKLEAFKYYIQEDMDHEIKLKKG